MLLTLFGISVLIFVLLRIVPGNIADILFDAAGMIDAGREGASSRKSSDSISRSRCSTCSGSAACSTAISAIPMSRRSRRSTRSRRASRSPPSLPVWR